MWNKIVALASGEYSNENTEAYNNIIHGILIHEMMKENCTDMDVYSLHRGCIIFSDFDMSRSAQLLLENIDKYKDISTVNGALTALRYYIDNHSALSFSWSGSVGIYSYLKEALRYNIFNAVHNSVSSKVSPLHRDIEVQSCKVLTEDFTDGTTDLSVLEFLGCILEKCVVIGAEYDMVELSYGDIEDVSDGCSVRLFIAGRYGLEFETMKGIKVSNISVSPLFNLISMEVDGTRFLLFTDDGKVFTGTKGMAFDSYQERSSYLIKVNKYNNLTNFKKSVLMR